MIEKERLDILLVKKNIAKSRELAKAYIMAGSVYVDGVKEEKAGTKVAITADIVLKQKQMKYVSRGGYKLEKAITEFQIDLKDCICMDIGASTGGFTDCMLQNGAKKVYAIDVGYGQFDWKLRNDSRVVCMEKTNVRYITNDDVAEQSDFASIDVSFISLTKVLPAVFAVLKQKAKLVCLIKPQFEAGREKVAKKGVVKDKNVHKEVILKIIDYVLEQNIAVHNISYSPIKGPEGNIKYLIYLQKNVEGITKEEAYIMAENVVNISHNALDSVNII